MLTPRTVGAGLLALSLVWAALSAGCRRRGENPPQAQKPPAAADSTKAAYNPYKANQNLYNRERENLGNLDSLVTPKEPPTPGR